MDEIQNEIEKTEKLLELLKERFAEGNISEQTFLELKEEYETKILALRSELEKRKSVGKAKEPGIEGIARPKSGLEEDVVQYYIPTAQPSEKSEDIIIIEPYKIKKDTEKADLLQAYQSPTQLLYQEQSTLPPYYPSKPKSTNKLKTTLSFSGEKNMQREKLRGGISFLFSVLGAFLTIVGICSLLPFWFGLHQIWPLVLIILGIFLMVTGKSISLVGKSEEEKAEAYSSALKETAIFIIMGLCVLGVLIGFIAFIAYCAGASHVWPLLIIGIVSLIILLCFFFSEELRGYIPQRRRREAAAYYWHKKYGRRNF